MITFISSPIITCIQDDAPVAKVISDQLDLRKRSSHAALPLLVGIIRTPNGPEFAFSSAKIPEYANCVEYYVHDKERTFRHLATCDKNKPDAKKKALIACYEQENSAARVSYLTECIKKGDMDTADFWFTVRSQHPIEGPNQAAFIELANSIAATDSDRAIKILLKIRSAYSNNVDVDCSIADIFYKQKKDPIRAEWSYRRALCADTTNQRAHFSLGSLLYASATENDKLLQIGIEHIKRAGELKEAKEIPGKITPEKKPEATSTTALPRQKRSTVIQKQPPRLVRTTVSVLPEDVLVSLTKAPVTPPSLQELASLV
ncbi:MAG: hypothetical protein JSR37_08020 [Verrucomicrobia bacterium]|nr:hypothetical protein [Verrucomicrobiota bacterium]MBS0636264.1 hypothetical protein [Verrucomicrobiota bacterium]